MNTEIKTREISVYGLLEEWKQAFYNYFYNGPVIYARELVDALIQLIPPNVQIPPGRPYASESKKMKLDMYDMGMELLYGHGDVPESLEGHDLEHVMLTVLDWLRQPEDEVKQHLDGQLVSLSSDLSRILSLEHDLEKLKAGLRKKMDHIQNASNKVEREGSPPLIDEKMLRQKTNAPV